MAWQVVSTPNIGSDSFNDVLCVSPGKFVAVGSNGAAIYSHDGGLTWLSSTGLAANDWYGLASDGTTVIAVSQDGSHRVGKSTDFGVTWTMKTAAAANSWAGVCSPSTGTFVAVSPDGANRVMKSTDSGDTWVSKSAASANEWTTVASNGDGSLLIAITNLPNGACMTSDDEGETWSSATPLPSDFQPVSGSGFGSNGLVWSEAAGKFACGGLIIVALPEFHDSAIATTTNGSSWTVTEIPGYDIGMYSLVAADSYGGFMGCLPFDETITPTPSIIGLSDDGGAMWVAEDTGFPADITWAPGAWDNSTGTVVFYNAWNGTPTNEMLIGTFAAPAPTITGLTPDEGSYLGGTPVTITGTNFSGTPSVTFDGEAATSVQVVNSTTITCVTPPGIGGVVDVVVTTAGGSATLPDAFTYLCDCGSTSATGLIYGALRLCVNGLARAGRTASAEQLADGFARLNDMINLWALEPLTIYRERRTTQTLAVGAASYTIGEGGDIDIVRPDWIIAAGLVLDTSAVPTTEVPIDVFTDQDWMLTQQKALTNALVSGVYFDHGWSSGLGLIFPWPVPLVGNTQLVLYTREALAGFDDLTTCYTFPPGYAELLRYHLAIRLGPEFGGLIDDARVHKLAQQAMTRVKRGNNRPRESVLDPSVPGGPVA